MENKRSLEVACVRVEGVFNLLCLHPRVHRKCRQVRARGTAGRDLAWTSRRGCIEIKLVRLCAREWNKVRRARSLPHPETRKPQELGTSVQGPNGVFHIKLTMLKPVIFRLEGCFSRKEEGEIFCGCGPKVYMYFVRSECRGMVAKGRCKGDK